MTFEKYLDGLNKFAKQNPDSLRLEAITAGDDEGNSYNHTHYSPCVVEYDGNNEIDTESETPNAVVVN
jgi:hypothetical protein